LSRYDGNCGSPALFRGLSRNTKYEAHEGPFPLKWGGSGRKEKENKKRTEPNLYSQQVAAGWGGIESKALKEAVYKERGGSLVGELESTVYARENCAWEEKWGEESSEGKRLVIRGSENRKKTDVGQGLVKL